MKKRERTKRIQNILLGIVAFALGAILYSVFNNGKAVPHQNYIDTQISQYSDKHITANATFADSRFKNLAFSEVSPKSLFSGQMAAVVKAVKFLTNPFTEKKEETKEYGSWVWTPIMDMTPEYIESILSKAKAEGVNTMYVSIDSYLDIFVMQKGEERERRKKIFGDILEDFIIRANKKGMAVDAEAGWQNWAEADNTYKAFAIVNYVKNFNETRPNKFRGFQYDVEPYLLPAYQEDKEAVLKNFVKLIDQTESFLGLSSLRFSVVIPDFYDEKDGFTPKFSYNGNRAYTLKHLLNIMDRRPESSIIIMSYRNFAEGKDGAIEISKNEIETAKRHETKIIIAQETGDVPPPYITFHNTSKNHLLGQISKINTAFNSYSNFGGFAIHYVNAFLALK